MTAEVSTSIKVVDNLWGKWEYLWLNVIADKIYWEWPLEVNFDWRVEWWKWPYRCSWDYWDWKTWAWEDTNHIFKNKGTYLVKTKCKDINWLTAEVSTSIKVVDNWGDLSLLIDANPIVWNGPLEVNFISIISWWKWPFSYFWYFWDWSIWKTKIIKHIFIETWIYKVKLKVIDKEKNEAEASVFIKVLNNICSNDSDWDWINDCEDKCPLIKWIIKNEGCPIFLPPIDDPTDWLGKCLKEQKSSSFIFWNVSCNSCPCNKSIDFRSTIRNCDTIIPAITSPTEKDIYSRWSVFQIKN